MNNYQPTEKEKGITSTANPKGRFPRKLFSVRLANALPPRGASWKPFRVNGPKSEEKKVNTMAKIKTLNNKGSVILNETSTGTRNGEAKLTQKQYGEEHKLTGQKLKRVYHKYLADFSDRVAAIMAEQEVRLGEWSVNPKTGHFSAVGMTGIAYAKKAPGPGRVKSGKVVNIAEELAKLGVALSPDQLAKLAM